MDTVVVILLLSSSTHAAILLKIQKEEGKQRKNIKTQTSIDRPINP
jgi:hypothetical protein